jgi:hypothetical protein
MMKELGHDIYHFLAVPSLILLSPPRSWVKSASSPFDEVLF